MCRFCSGEVKKGTRAWPVPSSFKENVCLVTPSKLRSSPCYELAGVRRHPELTGAGRGTETDVNEVGKEASEVREPHRAAGCQRACLLVRYVEAGRAFAVLGYSLGWGKDSWQVIGQVVEDGAAFRPPS